MNYVTLSKDILSQKIGGKSDVVLDQDSKLWSRLLAAGAQLKGSEDLFPALLPDGTIASIPYNVRRAYTESGNLDLGGHTLLDAVVLGESHQFWSEVDLPGPLGLWGAAALVTPKDGSGVLLGKKEKKVMDVDAVFGGTWTPPAGIVGFEDYIQGQTLEEALVRATLRELKEETGLDYATNLATKTNIFLELARCKQQAVVIIKPERVPVKIPGGTELELKKFNFFNFSPEALLIIDLQR